MKFAKRFDGISASPTMAVMQEAQRLKKEGVSVIDFGPGEPDFPTPEPIKEAGIRAIRENFTKYTASAGILELRQAIAEKLNRQWDSDFTAAHVLVTCGAKHAIYNLCMTLFEEGDDVLIPVPYWVTFPEVIRMTGAVAREVLTPEHEGFVLKTESIRAALNERTRGLILNSPNNPTGAVIPEAELRKIVELSREKGLLLLFDETYEYFTYGGLGHVSVASMVRSSEECFAIVGSVSKTYSMTGWRIGYCAGNRELIEKINEFQSHETGNPTSISQKAALAALRSDPALVQEMKSEYERRLDVVMRGLDRIPGFSCVRPQGAFYVFPNVSQCLQLTGIADSQEFAQFLLKEAHVAVVPGSAFGLEGFIRLSYATSMENIEEGLRRIEDVVAPRVEQARSFS